jgi:hypothetical protein
LLGFKDGTLVGLAVLGLSVTGFWVGSPVARGKPSPSLLGLRDGTLVGLVVFGLSVTGAPEGSPVKGC